MNSATMQALVYMGPEHLEIREVPKPSAGAGEVLVRVEAVGICGSDMHAYLGHDERRPAPLILGHEAAGLIEGGPKDGVRVTLNPLVTDPKAEASQLGRENLDPGRQIISMPPREGAFAQYVCLPERNLVEVPDGTSLEAAALAEPLACGWHAIRLARATLDVLGRSKDRALEVLVIGGGAIGAGAAACAQVLGAADSIPPKVRVSEPNGLRRTYLAEKLGMDVMHPEALERHAQFDLVVDAVGFEATRATASARARPGGLIMHIGLGSATGGLDIRRMTLQEIGFIGTYTYNAQDFRDTAQAIFDGRFGDLMGWLDLRDLAGGAKAFSDIREGRTAAPKVMLHPWNS